MKKKIKIFMLSISISILLCGVVVLQSAAQEPQELRISENVEMQRQKLRQMDQDIERLRQMTREAEEIHARIARESQLPDVQKPKLKPQPQRQDLRELPPATELVQPGAKDPRQNQPLLSKPGMQKMIDNIPQMIDQLREAFNNNIERVHNTYQRIQEKMINLQSENERLRIENQQLRDENQRLRNRLQEIEPRRAPAGQVDTFGQP